MFSEAAQIEFLKQALIKAGDIANKISCCGTNEIIDLVDASLKTLDFMKKGEQNEKDN